MKPLTHWAIHHQQKLRIAGHDRAEIWGALAGPDGAVRPFRYAQQTMQLTIGGDNDHRILQLDAYGFEQPPIDPNLPTRTCQSLVCESQK